MPQLSATTRMIADPTPNQTVKNTVLIYPEPRYLNRNIPVRSLTLWVF
jgi:hypothetical protein